MFLKDQECCLQDQAAHVRRALLRKIHHYLRDRTLNLKYASAYALCAVDTEKDIALEVSLLLIFSKIIVIVSVPCVFETI